MPSQLHADIRRFLQSDLAAQPEYVKAYVEVVTHKLTKERENPDLELLQQLLTELRATLDAIDQGRSH